jgi:P27 family predicted phage terminase small subunit
MQQAKKTPEKYTGQKGRKALTPAQKAQKNRVAGRGEPMKAPIDLPDPPSQLSAHAQAEWDRIGRYLKLTERVAAVDRQSLAAYVSSFTLYCGAMEALLVNGQPLWGLSNMRPKRSVFCDIAFDHGRQTIRLARQFGMTARCRHLDHRVTGRPATPQEIHDLRGTEKRRKPTGRIAKSVEFDEDSVRPPDWFSLSEIAIREWDRLVGQLSVLDLWTPLDVAAVTVGCASFALVLTCCDRLKEELTTIEVGDGVAVQNPLLAIRSRHVELCSEVWKDYGMNPMDRVNFSRMDGRDDSGDGPHKLAMFPEDAA